MRKTLTAVLIGTACCSPRLMPGEGTSASDGSSSTTHQPSTSTTLTTSGPASTSSTTRVDYDIPAADCNTYQQDCPGGEKCVPWADDGGASFNATKCVPVSPDPDGLYEPCQVDGSFVTGEESCDHGLLCWAADFGTSGLEGSCAQLCEGSKDAPICPAGTECLVSLDLCLPPCSPLSDDCLAGDVCAAAGLGFECVMPTDSSSVGEACVQQSDCNHGLRCVPFEQVPNCPTSDCCTEYCDPALPRDTQCTLAGQSCEPLYAPDQTPPWEPVGTCSMI